MIISGYAEEMLQPLAPTTRAAASWKQILAATERISNLTAQLLQFTRKQADPAERVDLAGVLTGLGGACGRNTSRQTGVGDGEPQQLEEILTALVSAREGASRHESPSRAIRRRSPNTSQARRSRLEPTRG